MSEKLNRKRPLGTRLLQLSSFNSMQRSLYPLSSPLTTHLLNHRPRCHLANKLKHTVNKVTAKISTCGIDIVIETMHYDRLSHDSSTLTSKSTVETCCWRRRPLCRRATKYVDFLSTTTKSQRFVAAGRQSPRTICRRGDKMSPLTFCRRTYCRATTKSVNGVASDKLPPSTSTSV